MGFDESLLRVALLLWLARAKGVVDGLWGGNFQ